MTSNLTSFEAYATSLTNLGVFPSFNRLANGWTCVLRNGTGDQIMPFNDNEHCWGSTLLEAITKAVEGLNGQFLNAKELHQYVDTGVLPNVESFQNAKVAYAS